LFSAHPDFKIHARPLPLSLAILGLSLASASVLPAYSFNGLGDYLSSFYADYYESERATDSFRSDEDSGQEKSTGPDQKNVDKDYQMKSERDFENFDLSDPEYAKFLTNFNYVLYYGGFDSRVAEAILAVKPTLLVTNYEAIGSEIRRDFAMNNISVIAYLPIHWTDRSLDLTLDRAQSLLEAGADGIFVDEATTVSTDWEYWYHGRIYETVKEFDEDALVIINPGTGAISERAMEVSDVICFEHEWRYIANLSWASDYPGWRFMGISSNEFVKVMGYHVGASSARDDLDEARSLNIAYHYSADHYIWLPPWLDVYGGSAFSMHPVTDYDELDLSPVARSAETGSAEEQDTDPPTSEAEDPDHIDAPRTNNTQEEPSRSQEEPSPPKDRGEEQSDDNSTSANKPPRARAGEDQDLILEEDPITVYLDGMATDPDSDNELSFLWQQTEGPEVNLIDADSQSTSFVLEPSLLSDGSNMQLRFKLTATDSDGATDADRVDVQVSLEQPNLDDATDNEETDANNTTDTGEPPDIDQGSDTQNNQTRSSERESNYTSSTEEKESPTEEEQSDNSTGTSTD
jgi:hypothetical protein